MPLAIEVPDLLQGVQVDQAHSQDKEYQPHHIEPVDVGNREKGDRLLALAVKDIIQKESWPGSGGPCFARNNALAKHRGDGCGRHMSNSRRLHAAQPASPVMGQTYSSLFERRYMTESSEGVNPTASAERVTRTK